MDQSFYETGLNAEKARYEELARVEDAARVAMADIDGDKEPPATPVML